MPQKRLASRAEFDALLCEIFAGEGLAVLVVPDATCLVIHAVASLCWVGTFYSKRPKRLGHFIMVHDVMLCLAGSVPCNGSSPPVNCASVIPHAMCAHPHNKSLGGTALSYRARVSIN